VPVPNTPQAAPTVAAPAGNPAPVPTPPTFVYPVDGQRLDSSGAYMFKVTAVPGAAGYLFGFFQDGGTVWENCRDEGTLSGPEYAIWPGTAGHARFHPGDVDVWVRGLVGGQWTEARVIRIHLADS
jgi:hypothetical protein